MKAEVKTGWPEMRDNIGLIIVNKLSYVFSVIGALLNVVMNCGNTPHVLKTPFHTTALPTLSVQYTTPFTDARNNQRQTENDPFHATSATRKTVVVYLTALTSSADLTIAGQADQREQTL